MRHVLRSAVFCRRISADMDRMVCSFAGIYSMYHRWPLLEKRYERRSHRGHARWICYGVRLVLPVAGDHKYPHIFRSSGSGYRSLYHRQQADEKPPQEVLDLFYYAKSFDPADADSEAVSPAKAVAESSDGTKPSTVSAGIQMSADQFRAVLENA